MNKLDKTYTALLQDILDNGVTKSDRTGTGTISVFGRQIRHKMSEGFPLLTTKKMAWKTIVTELLWFLRGDTNIKYLVDNDCHIWDGDCFSHYCKKWEGFPSNGNFTVNEYSSPTEYEAIRLTQEEFINKIKIDDEFAEKWGELGPIYGKQWRSWKRFRHGWHDVAKVISGSSKPHIAWLDSIDQISNLINDLKTNPDSRRLMVNAWSVGELDQMVLPPCHYGFQVYTRELSLEERWKFYHKKDLDINRKHGEWDSFEQSSQKNLDNLNVPKRAISLMYNARSQDVPLGTPFNIASYALLLEIIAKMVNMVPDELISNMGDCHIYLNQIDGVKKQLTREPYPLPKLIIPNQVNFNQGINEFLNSCLIIDFQIEGYNSHPSIKIPLSN